LDRSVFKKIRRLVPFRLRVEYFRLRRRFQNYGTLARYRSEKAGPENFPVLVFSHNARLYRDYPEPWFSLQKNKVVNLTLAARKIDGRVLAPGDSFSFWDAVGPTSRRRGYVDGMTLIDGEISSAIGGGLCQISNALYWTALHLGMTITERHRHSFDCFPDSYRAVPFGAGATVFYNYVDLRFCNTTPETYRLKVTLDDEHLRIAVFSAAGSARTYRVVEENHRFDEIDGVVFRENDLYRESLLDGKVVAKEHIAHNRGRVLYPVSG
jgi:vancomycin resistance protein VanW